MLFQCLSVTGSNFKNISGHVLNLDKEIEDIGIYNVENVVIDDCSFEDIGGVVLANACGPCIGQWKRPTRNV